MKLGRIKTYFLTVAAVFTVSFSAQAERRVALVIGNGAYDSGGSLANPPNDAKLISGTLRSVGFDVIERINVDQKSMKIAIKAFRRKLTAAGKDAIGLFYYAGHGVQVGAANYLIPVNASIENESDVDIEAVTANTVLRSMEFAGNRLNIVIMDACRNNPYKRGFRSGVQGLARMDATSGMLIAYATAPGDVAADGKGRNSPYTAALAAGMRRPGLSVEQMFKRVRVSVQHRTKNAQTPWESSSLTGDFYFVRGSKGSADRPSATTAEADDTQEEIAYWQSLQDSQNPKDFLAYINRYGENGAFFILARNRAKALLADKVDGAAPARQPSPDGKSDQELAAEALLRGRKMMAELFSNANHVMGLGGISMGERIEKFRGLLGGVVDFRTMAKFVVGKHYETATPDEWAHFYATYKELFLSGYKFSSGRNWTGNFEVEKIRAYGKDTLISVRLERTDGQDLKVGFRVRRKPNSFFGFKIIDALTGGVSMLTTQRADFRSHLTKGGLPYLTAALEKKFGKAVKPVEIPD